MTVKMTSKAVIKVSAKMSTKMQNSLDIVRGFGFLVMWRGGWKDAYKWENTGLNVYAWCEKTVWMKVDVGGKWKDETAM